MTQALRHYLLALQYFTRIPLGGALARWVGFSPAMLRASAAHLPGVGLLLGLLLAGASAALWALLAPNPFKPLLVACLGTALGVLFTGGFHEDGLADVADGLGGSQDRQRALEIMKDSRVGSFGVLALVLALGTKLALLASLGALGLGWLLAALVAGHTVSRAWPLLLIRTLAHVGDAAQSKSRPLAEQISAAALAAGFMWCFMALALVSIGFIAINSIAIKAPLQALGPPLALALGLSAVAALAMRGWLQRRLQGFTGDGLGATQQVCELAFYLGLLLCAA
ncbi:MAG: adenosylcobinamide-GDP ribazoletransferase [Rhodoferax sp.]